MLINYLVAVEKLRDCKTSAIGKNAAMLQNNTCVPKFLQCCWSTTMLQIWTTYQKSYIYIYKTGKNIKREAFKCANGFSAAHQILFLLLYWTKIEICVVLTHSCYLLRGGGGVERGISIIWIDLNNLYIYIYFDIWIELNNLYIIYFDSWIELNNLYIFWYLDWIEQFI